MIPHELFWTSEKPTVPGLYWWRDKSGYRRFITVDVDGWCPEFGDSVVNGSGEFAGPIPIPKDRP
jgi:hypothetical protein